MQNFAHADSFTHEDSWLHDVMLSWAYSSQRLKQS